MACSEVRPAPSQWNFVGGSHPSGAEHAFSVLPGAYNRRPYLSGSTVSRSGLLPDRL